MQGPKEDAVKDEVVSSTNLLDADDRRDQAMAGQIDAMQKDLAFEQKLRSAMAEQKMRSERRNLVPGVIAVDCSGRQIVTKETCDAEKNTVFRDGTCVVSGGDNPPEYPGELAAANAARKDEEAIEKAMLESEAAAKAAWGPAAKAKKYQIALKASEQDLAREKAKFSKDSAGAPVLWGKAKPDQQHKMDDDQAHIKDKEKQVAELQKDFDEADKKRKIATDALAEKQKLESRLRDQHTRDLEKLLKEEDKVEQDDVAAMAKADKDVSNAEGRMDKAQRDLSDEETTEAKILREEADVLSAKAARSEGAEQADLQKEAQQARLWQREAEWEANASLKKDMKGVAAENVAQKNAYRKERAAMKDADRDAYANGEDQDDASESDAALKNFQANMRALEEKKRQRLAAEQGTDTKLINETFRTEKQSEQDEIDGTETKAAAEEDRNSAALREAETQHKLKEEMDHKKQMQKARPTASLSVDVHGWPFQGQSLKPGASHSNPAKLAGSEILLRSELNLPLEAQAAVMRMLATRRISNLKTFL